MISRHARGARLLLALLAGLAACTFTIAPATADEQARTERLAIRPQGALIDLPAAHREARSVTVKAAPPTSCVWGWDQGTEALAWYAENKLVNTHNQWTGHWECLAAEPGSEYGYLDANSEIILNGVERADGVMDSCEQGDLGGCLGVATPGQWDCSGGAACAGNYTIQAAFIVELADGWTWTGPGTDGPCRYWSADHTTIACLAQWSYHFPAVRP